MPSQPRVDRTLRFYEEVLGLGYLHYGLWESEPQTLEGFKAAQQRYAEKLLSWVPAGVSRVLDVGCGTGGNAKLFSEHGYQVEGLSPDPFQKERFEARTGLLFHLGRFEELEPGGRFELVLMSESSQYIRISRLFDAVKRAAPGGWLLVCDYFVYSRTETPLGKSGHVLESFKRRAGEAGLVLEREEDITEGILPTLVLARSWVDRYILPTMRLVESTMEERHPYLLRLLKWVLGSRIQHIQRQEELIDAQAFKACKSYRLMLFKIP
jgi:MPBQ/MSBQ methyltransferase